MGELLMRAREVIQTCSHLITAGSKKKKNDTDKHEPSKPVGNTMVGLPQSASSDAKISTRVTDRFGPGHLWSHGHQTHPVAWLKG